MWCKRFEKHSDLNTGLGLTLTNDSLEESIFTDIPIVHVKILTGAALSHKVAYISVFVCFVSTKRRDEILYNC